jgi:hypothetical protein
MNREKDIHRREKVAEVLKPNRPGVFFIRLCRKGISAWAAALSV